MRFTKEGQMKTFEITFYEERKWQATIHATTQEEALARINKWADKQDAFPVLPVDRPTIEIEFIKPMEEKDVRREAH
jgi:hypothetical protein